MSTIAFDSRIVLSTARHTRRRHRKDSWLGFGCSVSMHAALVLAGGLFLIKPIEFGVDQGLASLDVQLVAGTTESTPVVQDAKENIVPEPIENLEAVKTPAEQTPVEQEMPQSVSGNSELNATSTNQGAQTQAVPSYLNNPSPPYPLEARRKGWQGTVQLKVSVGKDGLPLSVEIEKTSGHRVLDEAAVKTVRIWHFNPARVGQVPVESSVVVPVRFDLKDA